MISPDTKHIISQLQTYFASKPVTKAWLFGSYSRGEEHSNSDIDLLVSYDKTQPVSLFTISGIYMDLKQLLNKEIDLVEENMLFPFAVDSAERDKILIYGKS